MHQHLVRVRTTSVETRVAFVAVLALLVLGFWSTAADAAGDENRVRAIHLPVPLADVGPANEGGVYWSDTYGACRSGCTRRHLGVDMIGPKMIPLLAAADGEVSWMRHDDARGNNLVIEDADGWKYHYIHINNDTPGTDDGANPFEFAFAEGIERGARVQAGQVVAYLGDSGNAEATVPHLHFEITDPDGNNINPTFSVDAALDVARNPRVQVPASELGHYDSFDALAGDLYGTLLATSPSQGEADALRRSLVDDGYEATIESFVGRDSRSAQVDRLYVAYFLRLPDEGGHAHWLNAMDEGWTLRRISDFFAESDEYVERYEGTDFEAFLDQIYEEVLSRAPDSQGNRFWLEGLEAGDFTRGEVVVHFSESDELFDVTAFRSEIVALTALYQDRMPTDAEIDAWADRRATDDFATALNAVFP